MPRLRRTTTEQETTIKRTIVVELVLDDDPAPEPAAPAAPPAPDPDNEESGVFPRLAPGPQALAHRPPTDLALWREQRREAS